MDEEKDEFYNQLRDSVASCSSHDMILVMGDLNAYGSNNINREEVLGKLGVGVMNDNGKVMWPLWYEWLSCIWNSFPHKEIHKLTWKSPGGKTVNQLDPVFVNERMRTSILDTRVMRGTDIYDDYYLVRTRMRLKLAKAHGKKKTSMRFDVC